MLVCTNKWVTPYFVFVFRPVATGGAPITLSRSAAALLAVRLSRLLGQDNFCTMLSIQFVVLWVKSAFLFSYSLTEIHIKTATVSSKLKP